MDSSLPPDDDGLWDELNHQQSREIQQHHSRVRRSHAAAVLKSVAQQTAAAVSTAASAAAAAAGSLASSAYQTVPTNESKNLSDFGLESYADGQRERRDPLLEPNSESYGYQSPQNNSTSSSFIRNDSSTSEDGNFVLLNKFRLFSRREGWGAVANLDLFFASIYNYYYHRGFMPIVGKGVVELVSLFLTLWLSVFLFAYLDWKALSTCTDEHTCRGDFKDYVLHKPFSKVSLWNFIVILYILLFICYGAFAVWSFFYTVRDAWESKYFFEERLGISARKLEGGAVEWDRDVVSKMLDLQQSGEYRISIHGQGNLDALVVAQRIMRKENFLITFFNIPMLDLRVPFLNSVHFSKSLEWSLYFCVLNYMFNHKYQIRPAFYLDPASLRRRFMMCGVAHAVFMPFLLFFMTLHFSMQNIYDWKSTKKYLGPREWSLSSKWTMREFNELPHFFERRLGPSYEAAEAYLKLFTQSPVMTALGRIMMFVGGSLGAVLIVFAAINDSILLHVKIGNWNLLWYVGIFGVMYSGGKSMLPDPDAHPKYTRNLFAEMDRTLSQVTKHTHHYPDSWKGRGWRRRTYVEFSSMFKYKAQLFAMEILSVIVAPIVLCLNLPKCAEHICEVVMQVKTEVPGAGEMCGFATFDFDSFQDENWEGEIHGADVSGSSRQDMIGSAMASTYLTQNVETARALHSCPKTRQGKLEKSFFSFKTAHPTWKCSQSGQHLVDRVTRYQQHEIMELARERQLHIEAAARQLETLSQLERRKLAESNVSSTPAFRHVDDSYMMHHESDRVVPDSGADSGGGGTGTAPTSPLENATSFGPQSQANNADSASPKSELHAFPSPTGASRASVATSKVHFEDIHRRSRPSLASSGGNNGMLSASSHIPDRLITNLQSPTGTASVLHYADIGLSAELQRMLNRSTLEADVSTAGSVLGGVYDPSSQVSAPMSSLVSESIAEDVETATERQYLWLERYHSHIAEQKQGQRNATHSPGALRSPLSASDGMAAQMNTSAESDNGDIARSSIV